MAQRSISVADIEQARRRLMPDVQPGSQPGTIVRRGRDDRGRVLVLVTPANDPDLIVTVWVEVRK